MINKIKILIENQNFNPSWFGILVNPFFIARRGLAVEIKSLAKELNGKILDVGCGTKPYESFFNYSDYIGLEYDTGIDSEKKTADYYYDGKTFPFDSESFDSVICNQVLEHVFEPKEFLLEINRILKPGGKFLITVPFVWDEHEQPYDFARYSSFGLVYLLEKNGFKILKQSKSVSNIAVIFQLLGGYFYKISYRRKILKWLFMLVIIFPLNFLGIIFGKIFPDNNDLYLDNIILAQKYDL
ncbi:class I SAM-dependent methyltransferase [Ignavibacterium sp.]|uniref:class I SAM-dependent methyltransferase n=1 Tax=Ignavibacterium sp. TaxID=2651167 RepID=UPI00307DC07D